MTHLVLLQLQEAKFIDSERLEGGMEEGYGMQPLQPRLDLRSVNQETREQQATWRKFSNFNLAVDGGLGSLEQHDHCAYQTRNARVGTCNRDEQDHACRGQVEEHKREDELPESCHGRNKADEAVHNTSKEQWWDNA